ncbi:hypothetical protein JXB02_01515 [Candidatus Woesearchaeota archaeon]|nr:hypothetical protein [Candidatus Woesearchaeota archaeon]
MRIAYAIGIIALLLAAGCTTQPERPIGGDMDEHGCLIAAGYSWCEERQKCLRSWEEECTPVVPLTKDDAYRIAGDSLCVQMGALSDEASRNDITGSWWIGLEMSPENEKPGCNPACVVLDESRNADINWRCTGLILPEEGAVSSFGECVAAGNPVMESYPRRCRDAEGNTWTEELPPSGPSDVMRIPKEILCNDAGGTWLPAYEECEYVSEEDCVGMGGEYFECGSACRNDPEAEICTLQCVPYCALA